MAKEEKKELDIFKCQLLDSSDISEKILSEFLRRHISEWSLDDLLFPEFAIYEFRERIERYAKRHPKARIAACVFVYDGRKSDKPTSWKFESGND